MFMFGAGNLFLTPRGVANPTPMKVGTLQEVSFDISFESKELYGNKQFPVMVARGKGKITGKAKSGEFRGGMIMSILSGATQEVGRKIGVVEVGKVPAAATYTIDVTNKAAFDADLGVINTDTDKPMVRVAANPATGEYAVAAGVYTFAAADANANVQIAYTYTDATTGVTTKYSNQLMGAQLIYQLGLYNEEPDGSMFGIMLKSVVVPKLSMGFKNDDFTMPDLDLSAFAASDDTILEAYSPH